jgi:hypothetical protein
MSHSTTRSRRSSRSPTTSGDSPSQSAVFANSLLGMLDSWTQSERSSFLWASRRLCCSGQSEKASKSKLSNLPSLRKLRRIGRHALETKTLSTAMCDSVHLRPFDRTSCNVSDSQPAQHSPSLFALLQRQPLLRGAQVFSDSQIGDSYDYCSCTAQGY